jgi:hypothetical protein
MKRVDGLEARLKEKTEGEAKTSDDASVKALEGPSVPQEAGTTSAKSEGNNSTQDSLLSPAPSRSVRTSACPILQLLTSPARHLQKCPMKR